MEANYPYDIKNQRGASKIWGILRSKAPSSGESGPDWSGVSQSDLAGIFQSEPGCQGAGVVKSSCQPGPSQLVLSLHGEYEAPEVSQHLLAQ